MICISVFNVTAQTVERKDTTLLLTIEVLSLRATDDMPFTKTNLNQKEIEKKNTGVDLPFILSQVPSVQVNSDAGNGIGYTGLRIRGSDASRINVTLNGIPYNDAETQGTFFVDLPDIASSSNSIQIQRGVGTSSNGPGAFGGSININTNDIDTIKSIRINNLVGSFRTLKNNVQLNTGLINQHFIFSGRISNVNSDGYIDRAKTKLQSFYTSAAWVNNQQSIRLNIFSGKEKTYAAWFGIDQATLDSNRTYNPAGTEKPGQPYDNQTDNYTQTHYQLFYNKKINEDWKFNLTGFLTTGKGYWEEYYKDQNLINYGLSDTTSDLITQSWLDNKFGGIIFSSQYHCTQNNFSIGGMANNYDGKNFGIIVKTITPNLISNDYKWYNLNSNKKDISTYIKWTHLFNNHLQSFVDVQYRNISYQINGFKYNPTLLIKNKYSFLNPKLGLSYFTKNNKFFVSYAKATKEPNRDDFETNVSDAPKPETLHDVELGYEFNNESTLLKATGYYMLYKDQLVLTGKVNDVFAYTRTNIPNSFRTGLELESKFKINKWMTANFNLNYSINKVKNYVEYIDEYNDAYEFISQKVNQYNKTDIAFSPNWIGGYEVIIQPAKHFELNAEGKFVGKQFLDNTFNKDRMMNGYFVQNIQLNYSTKSKNFNALNIFLKLNNIFSNKYVANGYTYSYYVAKDLITSNNYYPMATFNVMGGIGIGL
jgi:iron complex outermembrane receptor protein